MAVSITHTFVHTVPDEADTSEVRPSDWNAEHTVSGLGTAAEQNLAAFAQTANNLSDLVTVATARTNLGLGTAAVVNTGTSGTTIPLLDGANTWSAQNTFAAGTITTSQPATWTQTWNAAGVTFTGLKVNVTDTASAAASLLMDLQVGGASKLKIDKVAVLTLGTSGSLTVLSGNLGVYGANGANTLYLGGNAGVFGGLVSIKTDIKAVSTAAFGWSADATSYGTLDLALFRDAANTLAQRNGTAAQAFRLYRTYTDASNYERLGFGWDSGNSAFTIGPEKGGSGTLRSLFIFGSQTQFWADSSFGARQRIVISDLALAGGTGRVSSPSDGVIKLSDNSDSAFLRLQFGGTTSSFPALKRSTTSLQVRLADDSADGNFRASSITSISPTAGIGYATGAGGMVTQATSRSTGVTLSTVSGKITTTADSIAALGIVTFTVTNTAVAVTDTIILSKVSGDIDTSAWVSAVAAGSFDISLRNNDAVSADVTAFVVNFAVIKGVTS